MVTRRLPRRIEEQGRIGSGQVSVFEKRDLELDFQNCRVSLLEHLIAHHLLFHRSFHGMLTLSLTLVPDKERGPLFFSVWVWELGMSNLWNVEWMVVSSAVKIRYRMVR